MKSQRILLVTLLLLLPALALASGKIRGKIVDKDTRDALVGANVSLVGTTYGAAADVNGEYIILNVPAGVYTVKATFVGYASYAVSNVRVNNDLTTALEFALYQ